MIESIHIAKTATFGDAPQAMIGLKMFNYICGSNGSGKTTISRVIAAIEPVRYGFRTFDRQWLLPDVRVINRPNPQLWQARSESQVTMTAFAVKSPTSGPALSITGLIPNLDHYKGSFGGRVFPLWSDAAASAPIRAQPCWPTCRLPTANLSPRKTCSPTSRPWRPTGLHRTLPHRPGHAGPAHPADGRRRHLLRCRRPGPPRGVASHLWRALRRRQRRP